MGDSGFAVHLQKASGADRPGQTATANTSGVSPLAAAEEAHTVMAGTTAFRGGTWQESDGASATLSAALMESALLGGEPLATPAAGTASPAEPPAGLLPDLQVEAGFGTRVQMEQGLEVTRPDPSQDVPGPMTTAEIARTGVPAQGANPRTEDLRTQVVLGAVQATPASVAAGQPSGGPAATSQQAAVLVSALPIAASVRTRMSTGAEIAGQEFDPKPVVASLDGASGTAGDSHGTPPVPVPAGSTSPAAGPLHSASATQAQPASGSAATQASLSGQLTGPIFSLATAKPGEHTMTLSVTPEDLGPVTVRAHIGAEGVRVELFAPNDVGREALRSILHELRRDLASAGLGRDLDLSSRNNPDDPGSGPNGDGHPDRDTPTNRLIRKPEQEKHPHVRPAGQPSGLDVLA